MTEKLVKLIALILGLDPKDEAHFTKSQLPDSRVLAEKLGVSVSAAERDEAFEAFKDQYPEEATTMLAVLNPPDDDPPAEDEPAAEPAKKADESTMITGQDALKHLRSKGHKV